MKLHYFSLSFLILVAPHSIAQPKHGHAHEHGKGRLEISVDANQAVGKLKVPLEALVGFERSPKTEAETNAINTMNQKLQNPSTFFVANKDAECSPRLISSTIVRDQAGKHADLDYQFDLNCAKLAALKQLSIGLFSEYKRLKEIRVESIGPWGQKSATAKRDSSTVSF
jgi:Protein of unknown function (DUF2796)